MPESAGPLDMELRIGSSCELLKQKHIDPEDRRLYHVASVATLVFFVV